MATVALNAWSVEFPLISNRIRADVSTQLSPLAIVASITKDAPHPVRLWSFPGLPRTNYVFQLSEIDGTGAVVRRLAYFDVVPGSLDSVLVRMEEQIRVDVTPGLVSGANSFTFDGTGGKPDWRGWEISPEEYSGVGTLIRGTDYSWDKSIAAFAFLTAGRVFKPNQWYTVEFEGVNQGAGGSFPAIFDFSIFFVTNNYAVTPEDFGKKMIIEPAVNYIELTLPSLDTVIAGRYLMIETKSASEFRCVKFIRNGTDIMAFLHGELYMMMNEKLYLYKIVRPSGNFEWRICNEQGNFINCGELISNDLSNVYNRVLVNGGGINGLNKFQYARLYNEVVLRLPVGQRVNYDNWNSNQTLWSLANSTDPSFADFFRIPNRLGLVEKINPTGRLIGSYEPDSVGAHSHNYIERHANSYTGSPTSAVAGSGAVNPEEFIRSTGMEGLNMSTETKMKNFSTNKYILV